ncbi:cell wall-associated NlpC family hydrolase [Pseudomonas nitritireducens]|uniref:Cell wall-associated NlpC family hydrolase n=1 Tax=Pseudomonas nitroreducens TaxID=46680 RepID=A0A7W7P4A8_PSENT|nr:C40 family peptidase [Pseudomonas nitritireducens]MBB4866659.1 cell wall-associated NlpC family hydrolase [Pseudomonas nitritireducens]
MRLLRWLLFYLFCVLGAPLVMADDLDAPAWRRYDLSVQSRSAARRADSGERNPAGQDARLTPAQERAMAKLRELRRKNLHLSERQSQRIIARAHELIGTPYRWGGETVETGFDCSGLLVYLYRSVANRKLPRTTASMIAQRHNKVDRDQLQPGDAVFFNHNGEGSASHVGLYIGDDRFIHAPSTGKTIRIDSLDNSYWQRSYTTARRFSG